VPLGHALQALSLALVQVTALSQPAMGAHAAQVGP